MIEQATGGSAPQWVRRAVQQCGLRLLLQAAYYSQATPVLTELPEVKVTMNSAAELGAGTVCLRCPESHLAGGAISSGCTGNHPRIKCMALTAAADYIQSNLP